MVADINCILLKSNCDEKNRTAANRINTIIASALCDAGS